MRNHRFAALSFALLFASACSDSGDGNQFGTGEDVGQDTATDTVEDTATDAGQDTTSDAGQDTTTDTVEDSTADAVEDTDAGGGGFDEAAVFYECDVDDDCEQFNGKDQICVRNVCVVPPTAPAYMSDDEGNEAVEYEDEAPETACFDGDQIYEPAGEDREITLVGTVERFGSGPTTEGLCLTIYDETALLPWLVNSECNLLAEEDEEEYIGCFQLDPCRCIEHFDGVTDLNEVMIDGAESAMDAAGNAMDIDSVEACFSFIGYCDGIEDADMKADCVARVHANGLTDEVDSLVHSFTRTTEDVEDSMLDEPEGTSLYELENVPTNWRYATKVSGRENRWRDTWEYGHFTRGDMVREDGTLSIDGTAVSAGAWATIPPAVGLAGGIDDTHGAVAGVIRDCGTDERNPWAIVHATVGISFNQGSVLSYFNGNPDDRLPNPARVDTNVLGTFAAIDLPPGPNRVAPIICVGECSSREDYVFAGAKNVFQTPKSVIIATFEGYFDL